MKAILAEKNLPRLAITKIFSIFTPQSSRVKAFLGPWSAVQLKEIADPILPSEDWAIADTQVCGLCGSDYKQVFMNGTADNPMTSMISWPQVMGHEVIGLISETGSEVKNLKVGDRVVLNPWLSCVTRGMEPCSFCQRGKLAQCLNFDKGYVEPGIHHGNSATATGGFSQKVPAHESQWFKIPEGITNEEAVLSDPFSVSFHAILKVPPKENSTVLIYGCGTLGLLAIAILRMLHPTVKILAVARYAHQGELAKQFGAHRIIKHLPEKSIIDAVADECDVKYTDPWKGLPMLTAGVSVVYDTVSSAKTLEVGLRIAESFGSIVVIGVEPSKRFEWTPIYFKELNIVGSNGFGIEEYEGRKQHAFEWYFEFIQAKKIDATAIITHQYALRDYKNAFATCYSQGNNRAVKVLFTDFK